MLFPGEECFDLMCRRRFRFRLYSALHTSQLKDVLLAFPQDSMCFNLFKEKKKEERLIQPNKSN
jgi:hypothetical protein